MNFPHFLKDVYDYSVCWQMSVHERAAMLALLSQGLPNYKRAIEIGSYCGGFTRHLADHFDTVECFDLDFSQNVAAGRSNVKQYIGDSSKLVPETLPQFLNDNGKLDCSFILIDGNHEYDYVRSDLQNVLGYRPQGRGMILVHDSWFPPSRRAILETKFPNFVEFVDLDFCSGTALDNGTIVGGLALIITNDRKPPDATFEIRSSDWRGYDRMVRK